MRKFIKFLFVSISLILTIRSWIYDFLILLNYKAKGGYSIYSNLPWFHERIIQDLAVNILYSTIALSFLIFMFGTKRFLLKISFLIFFLVFLSFEFLRKNRYDFGHDLDFISDSLRISAVFSILLALTITRWYSLYFKNTTA